jgi:hypothetical protein
MEDDGGMVEPLELERGPYTGMLKVKAYCDLGNAGRIFLLDRTANATPMDTNLSIVA